MGFPGLYSLAFSVLLLSLTHLALAIPEDCPTFDQTSGARSPPLSEGKYALPYQRPEPRCRTFSVPEVDAVIEQMKGEIADPDLFRLFENTFPNTLDSTISWKGLGKDDPEEEVRLRIHALTVSLMPFD
jgi:hypothetical protein